MNLVFDRSKRRSASEVVLAEPPDHAEWVSGTPELRLALVDVLSQLSVVKMRNARALTRLRALLGDDFLATDQKPTT